MKKSRVKGAHYTIDFFGCDPYQIDSLEFWEKNIPASAEAAKMEILHKHFHKFDPQGITGFLLLASSHVSFHTWPEYNYVACDVFSCSNGDDTKKAVDYLKKAIEHSRAETHRIKRGYVTMEYFVSPVYSTGKKEHIKVEKKIADVTTPFQHLMILDTFEYGRCLILDNLVQTSEHDHEIYDRAILEKLSPSDKNILVLGGGDGYVAKTAFSVNPSLKLTVVDMDPEVVYAAKKHLGQKKLFASSNINIVIGDATTYMETISTRVGQSFDGIVCDLTDNPINGGKARKELMAFYKKIFSLSKSLLKDGGWISCQAGAASVRRKYLNSAEMLSDLIKNEFGAVERNDVFIPSFSEKNAFLYSRK